MLIEMMPRYGRGFTAGEFYYVALENYILIAGSLISANCAPHARTINGGCCINDTTTINHAIIIAIKTMLFYRRSIAGWDFQNVGTGAGRHIVFNSCNTSSNAGNSVQA